MQWEEHIERIDKYRKRIKELEAENESLKAENKGMKDKLDHLGEFIGRVKENK